MPKYAAGTTVTATRTEAEIKDLLARRGVTQIATFNDAMLYHIAFVYDGLPYRMALPLPSPDERRFTHYKQGVSWIERAENAKRDLFEKEVNRRWRAFGAVIKAKLIAVEEGISTLEAEFIGNAMTETGMTVSEQYAPQMRALAVNGRLPSIMPAALPPRDEE